MNIQCCISITNFFLWRIIKFSRFRFSLQTVYIVKRCFFLKFRCLHKLIALYHNNNMLYESFWKRFKVFKKVKFTNCCFPNQKTSEFRITKKIQPNLYTQPTLDSRNESKKISSLDCIAIIKNYSTLQNSYFRTVRMQD